MQILSLREKKAICEYRIRHPTAPLSKIVQYIEEKFDMRTTQSTVRRVLAVKEKYLAIKDPLPKHQRIRRAKCPELEEVLGQWYRKVSKVL